MRILITGENGYISSELTRQLTSKNSNYEVIKKSVRNETIETIDLLGIDIIIHAAAIVHKNENKLSESIYNEVNINLTETLAKKAKSSGVKHFIFISTMAVYGDVEGEITHSSKLQPKTLYGKSKLAAEKILTTLEDDNFIVSIIRPPMVYGPDCPGNYKLLSKISKLTFVFPKIKNSRSMIFIYNLTEFISQLIVNRDSGIFHPQDNIYVNTSDMVKIIAKEKNKFIFFSSLLGLLLKITIGKTSLFRKVFGNLYYSKELSNYRDNTYQHFTLKQSISITENE